MARTTFRQSHSSRGDITSYGKTAGAGVKKDFKNADCSGHVVEKNVEGPRMCMKTKDEKSDILEGPTMLMKNKQLNKLSCR